MRVNDEELEGIRSNMKKSRMTNMSEFMRQMAINGYVINIDFSELKSVVSQLKRIGNNINQITKIANSTGMVQPYDIESISEKQDEIWKIAKEILSKVSEI